jgi:hypothetical protein
MNNPSLIAGNPTYIYTTFGSAITQSASFTSDSVLGFRVAGNTVETLVVDSSEIHYTTPVFPDSYFIFNPAGSSSNTFTSYPVGGGYVEGNFTLSLKGQTSGNDYTATGNYRIHY